MVVYTENKKTFISDVDSGYYADKIENNFLEKMGFRPANAEINSWKNSIMQMGYLLKTDTIADDAGICIEYNIPTTSKRIDFIISGLDENKKANAVIIELKQWSEVKALEINSTIEVVPKVKTFVAGANRQLVHPCYQAFAYSEFIKNANSRVQDENIKLSACAYLHNYSIKDNDPILAPQYQDCLDKAPLFDMKARVQLLDFIKKHIKYGDKLLVLEALEYGKLRPSKSLQDNISSLLKGNEEFILLDDQKVIFEKAKFLFKKSIIDHKKRVLIVEGGPGSGKSVLAINLLAKVIKEGYFASYVSKNSAPRQVFSRKLINGNYKKAYINSLFIGSGSFINTKENTYEMLICDEAHRLNMKSGLFSKGENQAKEIINASLMSVFFIDEDQRVTAKDVGSISMLESLAKDAKADISKEVLESQFRCNGSDSYISFLNNLLDIKKSANPILDTNEYDFKVFDSAKELYDEIKNKNKENNKARLVAGYCWPWLSKNGEDINDIIIDELSIKWNLNNDSPFAIGEKSVEQCGCIHTTQGLEFSYVGVIIGPDIKYQDDKIATNYLARAKSDKSLDGLKTKAKKDPLALAECDKIIKNTYKTLMTRGLKGCYIYVCDEKLRDYIKSRLR